MLYPRASQRNSQSSSGKRYNNINVYGCNHYIGLGLYLDISGKYYKIIVLFQNDSREFVGLPREVDILEY